MLRSECHSAGSVLVSGSGLVSGLVLGSHSRLVSGSGSGSGSCPLRLLLFFCLRFSIA